MLRQNPKTMATMLIVMAMVFAACSSAASTSDESSENGLELFGADSGLAARQQLPADEAAPAATAAPASAPEDEAATAEQAPPEEPAAGNGGLDPVLASPSDLGRDIIFTAQLTVAVTDVGAAGAEAAAVIARMGGFVFGQDTTGGADPRTILTFKVLPEDFQPALAALGSIGELRSQTISTDDVTERVVDLKSRINTSQASVDRLRGFLENAQDLETIATLENQLLQRETDLETLRGQLRTIEDQVALATIVLSLTEARVAPAVLVESSFYPGHDDGGFACPGSQDLSVESGDDITACFFITNSGDTPLTDFTLVDSVLGITIDDLTTVIGDPAVALLPGESLMLAFETTVTTNLRTRTTVTATPADADGVALDQRPVASTVSGVIQPVDPGGITSFADGLAESWNALTALGRLASLATAWLLPFAWVPVVGWWLLRRRRRPVNLSESSSPEAPAPEQPSVNEPAPV